mmetsp:Transcript_57756/g.91822  ORF Transcript_57756/g.91822 Transcript_57756/m.91822 type:complete len:82 (+) Transcript_57756:36-281(+)
MGSPQHMLNAARLSTAISPDALEANGHLDDSNSYRVYQLFHGKLRQSFRFSTSIVTTKTPSDASSVRKELLVQTHENILVA